MGALVVEFPGTNAIQTANTSTNNSHQSLYQPAALGSLLCFQTSPWDIRLY